MIAGCRVWGVQGVGVRSAGCKGYSGQGVSRAGSSVWSMNVPDAGCEGVHSAGCRVPSVRGAGCRYNVWGVQGTGAGCEDYKA